MDDFLTDEHYQKAKENGISKRVAYQRFYQYGWDIKKAISEPVRKYPNLYPKWKKQCEEIGISQRAFYNRIQRGMTPEEAATTPKQSVAFWEYSEFNKHRKMDKRVEEVAKQHGISRKTCSARLARGWTIEQATTLPLGTYVNERNKQDETYAYAHFKVKS